MPGLIVTVIIVLPADSGSRVRIDENVTVTLFLPLNASSERGEGRGVI